MAHNNTPTVSKLAIHHVEPEHVEVTIDVHNGFATVTIAVGEYDTVLFTGTEKKARSIVAMLGMASTNYHTTPTQDKVLV